MALEHRQMHLETLAYMFHNFDYELKECSGASAHCRPAADIGSTKTNGAKFLQARRFSASRTTVPSDGTTNTNKCDACVPEFRMQRYSVTNRRVSAVRRTRSGDAAFLGQARRRIYYRGMFEEIPLPLDWPVYVTQLKRRRMRSGSARACPPKSSFIGRLTAQPCGRTSALSMGQLRDPAHEHGNFDFKRWDPEPVYATPAGDSAFGVSQLVGMAGNGPDTRFGPFPGFKPRETLSRLFGQFLRRRALRDEGRVAAYCCATASTIVP